MLTRRQNARSFVRFDDNRIPELEKQIAEQRQKLAELEGKLKRRQEWRAKYATYLIKSATAVMIISSEC